MKFVPNEWRQMMTGTMDEQLTATYIRACQPDCFDFYGFIKPPYPPHGLSEDFMKYHEIKNRDDKSFVWKELIKKNPGYFEAKFTAEAANDSNQFFLFQMEQHFKKLGMINYSEKCRIALLEFKQ